MSIMVRVAELGIQPEVLLAITMLLVVYGEITMEPISTDQATMAIGGGNVPPAVGGSAQNGKNLWKRNIFLSA